jgi:hypothetical protein
MQLDALAIRVLSKMYHYGYVGGRHTSTESLKRSFASHEKGMVDKAIKKLVKAGPDNVSSYKLRSPILIKSKQAQRN